MYTLAQHDWTVQSIVQMVAKGLFLVPKGIVPNAAWGVAEMSRYIESAIVGLPLGQVVTYGRGRNDATMVIDGYRRLAALALFTGVTPGWVPGDAAGFALVGAEFDPRLDGLTYDQLQRDEELLTAFHNASVTVKRIIHVPGADFAALRRRVQGKGPPVTPPLPRP